MVVSISLRNNNEREQGTKLMLEKILQLYDLEKYIRCREVIIEEGAMGKSSPVIRLSAWKPGSEDNLLAQFLHEQFHWVEHGKGKEISLAIGELKAIFHNAPIEKPEGGGSEISTYKHLIVCRLEFLALHKILGEEKATSVVSKNNNYTWIRKMVIEHGDKIDSVIMKYFPEVWK